jgi:ferric-dicitrate binding protein FerR (iron transport regulator)
MPCNLLFIANQRRLRHYSTHHRSRWMHKAKLWPNPRKLKPDHSSRPSAPLPQPRRPRLRLHKLSLRSCILPIIY